MTTKPPPPRSHTLNDAIDCDEVHHAPADILISGLLSATTLTSQCPVIDEPVCLPSFHRLRLLLTPPLLLLRLGLPPLGEHLGEADRQEVDS